MTQDMKMPPAANQGHSEKLSSDNSILPEHAGLVYGVYVAVIQIRGTEIEPRYRKRVYLNLPAANRAIARARMDNLDASIVLCQLTPINGVLDD